MLDRIPERSLVSHFSVLEDPRCKIKRRHVLRDMLVIAFAGVLCGAEGWEDIAEFGRAKRPWLEPFLELPNGIPSHDTFGRVFGLLAPEAFERCFRGWVEAIREVIPGEIIAVDGKCLRRSQNPDKGLRALHLISAWASTQRVVLGQVATDAKSNEITAIPELLALLMIQGCIVTLDAMGCQRAIADQILAQGGDYVLALKGNQGALAAEVEEAFIDADAGDYDGLDSQVLETVERGHGRMEIRRYRTLGDLSGVPRQVLWKGMNMIGMVESERQVAGQVTHDTRFYIGSIGTEVATFARAVRGHWSIENHVHWSLDVTFREDDSRVRDPQARENLALIRRLALTRLRQDDAKLSLHGKRLRAGWNEPYLAKLLFESPLSTTPPSTPKTSNIRKS